MRNPPLPARPALPCFLSLVPGAAASSLVAALCRCGHSQAACQLSLEGGSRPDKSENLFNCEMLLLGIVKVTLKWTLTLEDIYWRGFKLCHVSEIQFTWILLSNMSSIKPLQCLVNVSYLVPDDSLTLYKIEFWGVLRVQYKWSYFVLWGREYHA